MKRLLFIVVFFLIISSVFGSDVGELTKLYYNTDIYFKKNYENVLIGFSKASNQSTFFNDFKGEIGEVLGDRFFSSLQKGSWKRLSPRFGSQGLDHLYIKYDKHGNPRQLLVAESKYGSSKLGFTKDGEQFSDAWVKKRLEKILETNKNLTSSEKKLIKGVIDGKITYRKQYVHTEFNHETGQFKVNIIDKDSGKEFFDICSAKEVLLLENGKCANKLAKKFMVSEEKLRKLIENSDDSFSVDLMRFADKGELNSSISEVANLKVDLKQLAKGALASAVIASGITFVSDVVFQIMSERSFKNIDLGHSAYWTGAAGIAGSASYIARKLVTKHLTKNLGKEVVKQSAKGIEVVGTLAGLGVTEAVMFGAGALWDWKKMKNGDISRELYQEKLKKNAVVSTVSVGAGALVAGAVTLLTGGTAVPLAPGIAAGVTSFLTGLFYKDPTEYSPKVLWKKLENNENIGNQWCAAFMRDNNLVTNRALRVF